MNKKNQQLLWDLYAGIARDAKKNQRLLWKLYAGIARNGKKTQRIPWTHMRVLQQLKNVSNYLWPICGYCKRCQKYQRILWDLYAGMQ